MLRAATKTVSVTKRPQEQESQTRESEFWLGLADFRPSAALVSRCQLRRGPCIAQRSRPLTVLHGASGTLGDGEKFAQPQLTCWGPGPFSSCKSWPRLFSRFCKAQGFWLVAIQVLAQKRAQDASTKAIQCNLQKYCDSEFSQGSGFCAWDTMEKPCFPNPSWPLKLTPP